MAARDVIQVGTDPSGRKILMTKKMWKWWRRCVRRLGFEPTIVQGAHMVLAGGGAEASAGYHDAGGCLDLRLWDRTDSERRKMVRVFRSMGAGYWERGPEQGMENHAHLVFGSDLRMNYKARNQWQDYLAGFDGLAHKGLDYHWRPDPLVTEPPASSKRLRDILSDAKEEAKRIGRYAGPVKKLRDRIAKW